MPEENNAFDGVIFLPGLMCDERLFAPQLEALSPHYPCEVADLGGDNTFETMAERVLANTAFDRIALVGLSMGGALALNMARIAPDRIERMAILDASPYEDDPTRKPTRLSQLAAARKDGFEAITRNQLAKSYLAPQNLTHEMIDLLISMAERHGVDAFERQLNAVLVRQSSIGFLPSYTGKSLVLCGALDAVCPAKQHEEMHRLLPNSKLVIIPNCGHLATLEEPEIVNGELLEWLGG